MANRKITELPELTVISDEDITYVVDVSDTSESPDGTSKQTRLKTFNEVSDYASLLLLPTPIVLKTVKVLNDENKGIENTIYQLWPDGTRMWIAATEDI